MASIEKERRFEEAFRRALEPERGRPGNLGFVYNNNYTVFNPFNNAQYYVRVVGAGIISINHLNRVPPVPDLPVLIRTNPEGNLYIDSIDHLRLKNTGLEYQTGLEFGLHSHARFSGLEFDIDLRLLTYMRTIAVEALTVAIQSGRYDYAGELFWWDGTQTVDLSSLQPADGSHCWVLLGINVATVPHSIAGFAASAVPVETELQVQDLLDIYTRIASPSTFLPVEGVVLRGDQSILTEGSFQSIKPLLTGSSASAGNADSAGSGSRYIIDGDETIRSGYQGIYINRVIINEGASLTLADDTAEIWVLEA